MGSGWREVQGQFSPPPGTPTQGPKTCSFPPGPGCPWNYLSILRADPPPVMMLSWLLVSPLGGHSRAQWPCPRAVGPFSLSPVPHLYPEHIASIRQPGNGDFLKSGFGDPSDSETVKTLGCSLGRWLQLSWEGPLRPCAFLGEVAWP